MPANRQQFTAATVGEEAAETNSHKATRQCVKEESPQELIGGHGHQPFFVLVRIILPAECDLAVGKVYDPVIGNGDAMRVAGQILENMFGPAERWLRIDDPVLSEQRSQEGTEGLLFGEPLHTARERQFSGVKGALQAGNELATEDAAQNLYRQEESVTRVYPVLMIGREATSRDHAMDMRMDLQILSPGVQNAEEPDLSTQVFGVGRDLQVMWPSMVIAAAAVHLSVLKTT